MIYEPSMLAVLVFLAFVFGTVGLSFFLGRKTKSSEGYFAAHGQIPWAINGVAFAGDYLSAASFLGICGMIATYGYDGFLYSIGYLAGWIVALFVIAEPMKRLGRFTFADALDAKFNSRGIKAAAGISTLVVSVFYLIPQMVGAGVLIQPLLGYPHWVGVVMVGVVVIVIVVTAGMVSTTYVQFLKGSLLVIFSAVLVVMLLNQGLKTDTESFETIGPLSQAELSGTTIDGRGVIPRSDGWQDHPYVRLSSEDEAGFDIYRIEAVDGSDEMLLKQAQTITTKDGQKVIDGALLGTEPREKQLRPVGQITKLPGDENETGPLGPVEFLNTLRDSEVVL
ncbi:MAG: cation acetate symporter, partial [Rubripirellula sp.]